MAEVKVGLLVGMGEEAREVMRGVEREARGDLGEAELMEGVRRRRRTSPRT